ncbi:hypothetical protein HPB48_000281 [Haemaphysalis longicornis]|uniref:Uncharacterized protein n=1 Tax=Haemaphysalis longicornis TaxID=44386 RepID=A0A9J6FM01_HAELO|nr:hypothetical protein HPB48_000281 [Haemaphysalis longicornis]
MPSLRQLLLFSYGILMATLSSRFHLADAQGLNSSMDAECRYSCPGPLKPRPRASHRRTANGCGTNEVHLTVAALPHPDIEACCNEVDLCYDTCLADKARCDADFQECLERVCHTKAAARDWCEYTTQLFATMMRKLGCEFFLESQRDACLCKRADEL